MFLVALDTTTRGMRLQALSLSVSSRRNDLVLLYDPLFLA